MKRKTNSKKGISPIVAVVLLIALAVSLGAIITTWSTTLAKEKTHDISNTTGRAIDCANADISIDAVYLDFSANVSRVRVRNTGYVGDMSITSADVINVFGVSANMTNTTILPMQIGQGEIKNLEFNITDVINSCTNFSRVIVSTNCGGVFDEYDSKPNNC